VEDRDIRDMFGRYIQKDDIVIYGCSNRNQPVRAGIVQSVDPGYGITIRGLKRVKAGLIKFPAERLCVLPAGSVNLNSYVGC